MYSIIYALVSLLCIVTILVFFPFKKLKFKQQTEEKKRKYKYLLFSSVGSRDVMGCKHWVDSDRNYDDPNRNIEIISATPLESDENPIYTKNPKDNSLDMLLKQDVYLNFGFGKNLNNALLTEASITRSFQEVDIEFHARWSKPFELSNFTLGVGIDIPIPFFQSHTNDLIVQTSKRFRWGISYHDNHQGDFPKTGTSVIDFQKRLIPTYIRNNTELLLSK